MNTIVNPFTKIESDLQEIKEQLAFISSRETPKAEAKFYPISEASKKLGVAPITLYRGVESGSVPCKKVGTRILIPASFVEK